MRIGDYITANIVNSTSVAQGILLQIYPDADPKCITLQVEKEDGGKCCCWKEGATIIPDTNIIKPETLRFVRRRQRELRPRE